QVRRAGTQTSEQGNILPAGVELGSGVKTVGTPRLMTQGAIVTTGKETDVAIRGEGFFQITLPDGRTAYTRDGSFEIDAQGRLVTIQGNLVQPAITLPQNATSVTINAQGQVFATQAGSTTPTQVGQIELALFINKAGLQGIGDNLYLETAASGTPQSGTPGAEGFGNLQQGSLEQSNVEAVSEISDLIAAQRAYEMNAKVISASDQMLQATSNLFR
ncbi:MAG: flagellar basal-body rod protein FlgG, partial [Pseudorhodoplanes sp.]|nr:flagellar basal-body rod protein FlgG [Pseudorhodoplanes sp.]